MTEKWIRIDPADGNTGGPYGREKRVYGLDGEQYPRLLMEIHYDVLRDKSAVNLSCSRKHHANDDWCIQGIPANMITDAIEMLRAIADCPSNSGRSILLTTP